MSKEKSRIRGDQFTKAQRSAGGSSSGGGAADLWSIDILDVLRRRWFSLALVTALGCGLAVVYFLLAAPVYESRAQLLVMRKDPRLAAEVIPGSGTESRVSDDWMATQMQVVQSRKIISRALEAQQIDKLPSVLAELDVDEQPVDYIVDHLEVIRGGEGQAKDGHVLSIAFRHTAAEDTQKVLTAIVDYYRQFSEEKFKDVNSEAAQLIDKASSELSEELAAAESQYQEFRERAPLLWNGTSTSNIHQIRYEEIQNDLTQLSLQIEEAETRLEVVQEQLQEFSGRGASDLEKLALIDERNAERVGILITVQQGEAATAQFQAAMPERTANSQSEYQALLTLMMREKSLLTDLGPQHPEVEMVRNQINEARTFLTSRGTRLTLNQDGPPLTADSLLAGYVKLLSNDLETLRRRQGELGVLAAKEEEEAKALVKYEMEGEALLQQKERQQQLYDAVVDRLREINLAKDYGGFINEAIEEPELGKEVWPNLPICLALGGLLGLVLGTGGAVYNELRDGSFHTVEDIRRCVESPVLAQVSRLSHQTARQVATARRTMETPVHETVWSYYVPKSQESEVVRAIRTSLFFQAASSSAKVFAFSSPQQGDGKSTAISNLAVSIAQAGRRVLLVDADLRRPRQHMLFGCDNDVGVTDVLLGKTEPSRVLRATSVENLDVVPVGQIPDNPAELLTSLSFDAFVEYARDNYDMVLIDCPPVLAVADPCVIAPRSDGVVLVLNVPRATRGETRRAKEMLEAVGSQLLGVIVNSTEKSWGKSRGMDGYSYASEYRSAYLDHDAAGSSDGTKGRNGSPKVSTARAK
ncbi:MAG: polysaccharide biosynthesis tyrosine autokinase [Pirellulaceae bacterium]